jgi:hypothetical protein
MGQRAMKMQDGCCYRTRKELLSQEKRRLKVCVSRTHNGLSLALRKFGFPPASSEAGIVESSAGCLLKGAASIPRKSMTNFPNRNVSRRTELSRTVQEFV